MEDDIQAVIDRVRRATRNRDVITICDELQRRLAYSQKLIDTATVSLARDVLAVAKPKLSRAEIQKNYRLRKKRAG